MFGEGISKIGSLLDMAADSGIVKKSGSWYSYNDERLGQGRENAKAFLSETPDVLESIEKAVRDFYKIGGSESETGTESEEIDSEE